MMKRLLPILLFAVTASADSKSNLALRRFDIGKWDNEAAKQATREFHAEALPYIRDDRKG